MRRTSTEGWSELIGDVVLLRCHEDLRVLEQHHGIREEELHLPQVRVRVLARLREDVRLPGVLRGGPRMPQGQVRQMRLRVPDRIVLRRVREGPGEDPRGPHGRHRYHSQRRPRRCLDETPRSDSKPFPKPFSVSSKPQTETREGGAPARSSARNPFPSAHISLSKGEFPSG